MSFITLVFYLGSSDIMSIRWEGLDEIQSYDLALYLQSFPTGRQITIIAFSFPSNYDFMQLSRFLIGSVDCLIYLSLISFSSPLFRDYKLVGLFWRKQSKINRRPLCQNLCLPKQGLQQGSSLAAYFLKLKIPFLSSASSLSLLSPQSP